MFINAGPFLGIISSYRLVWFCGRFGGGKTSLAYAVSEQFLKQGYRLVTNNQSIWADDMENVSIDPKTGHLKTVVLMDEGGVGASLKATRQIEAIASYAAKMDTIYLVPSFWPPCRAMRILTCQPLFSLKSAGLPVIVYRWSVSIASFRDSGTFLWVNPSEIYGIYSRQDPGAQLDKVVQWLVKQTTSYRKLFHEHESDDLLSDLASEPTAAELMDDAVSGLEEVAGSFAAMAKRGNRRRRF